MSSAITHSETASAFDAPQAIERWNVGLGAGAVAASFAFATPHFALSLAAGALLEALNFRGLATNARATFANAQAAGLEAAEEIAEIEDAIEAPSPRWAATFSLRFVFTIAGLFYALWLGAHPIGLVLGVSLIVPAAVIGAWLHRPAVEPVDPNMVLAPEDPSWDRWSVWRAGEVDPRAEDDE